MLEDERLTSTFVGNAAGWNAHCANISQQCDAGSSEADPKLDSTFSHAGCRWVRFSAVPEVTMP